MRKIIPVLGCLLIAAQLSLCAQPPQHTPAHPPVHQVPAHHPTAHRRGATSPHAVVLTCSPATGTTPTGYNFFRGTASGSEASTPVNSSPAATCNYTDTTVSAATTYFYTVTEIVGGVSSGSSAEVSGVIPVFPASGVSLTISGTTGTVVWTPSSDGTAAYEVYVGTTSGGESTTPSNANPVAGGCTSTANCLYSLPGLVAGGSYYVTVKAVINGVLSVASPEASGSVTVQPPINVKMTVN
jgi:hypothetical protein